MLERSELLLGSCAISAQPITKQTPKLVDVKVAFEYVFASKQIKEPRYFLGSLGRAESTRTSDIRFRAQAREDELVSSPPVQPQGGQACL